jgi:hypothetical protein
VELKSQRHSKPSFKYTAYQNGGGRELLYRRLGPRGHTPDSVRLTPASEISMPDSAKCSGGYPDVPRPAKLHICSSK